MNRDHSVVFEIAPKYCISDSVVDHDGYFISSEGFLPTVGEVNKAGGGAGLVRVVIEALKNCKFCDFPGSLVGHSSPSNAGGAGLIPSWGTLRFHMPCNQKNET